MVVVTAVALDPRDHMTALLSVVDSALGEWGAFRYGELDNKPLPAIFALVSVERRFVFPDRGGMSSRSSWRALVRYTGLTSWEAERASSKVATALDGTRLTVDGVTSTPLLHESTDAIRRDEGRFSGESRYTYTL